MFPILYTSKVEKDVKAILSQLTILNEDVSVRTGSDTTGEVLSKHRLKQGYIELQLAAHRMVQAERRLHVQILVAVLAVVGAVVGGIIAAHKLL